MKLQSLDFRRSTDSTLVHGKYDRLERVETEFFKGVARFDGVDGSVSLALSDDEAKQILSLCAASLERVLTERANGMKNAIQSALVLNRNLEIGNSLPSEF